MRSSRTKNKALRQFVIVAAFFLLAPSCTAKNDEVNAAPKAIESAKTPQPEKSVLLSKKKIEKNTKLQSETDKLLPLFDKMPHVPTYIVDEPIINDGDETERASAYTLCENSNKPTILVKRVFYEKNKQKHIDQILRHELVHAWFCQQGTRVGHDEPFKEKLKMIEERARKSPASSNTKSRS